MDALEQRLHRSMITAACIEPDTGVGTEHIAARGKRIDMRAAPKDRTEIGNKLKLSDKMLVRLHSFRYSAEWLFRIGPRLSS